MTKLFQTHTSVHDPASSLAQRQAARMQSYQLMLGLVFAGAAGEETDRNFLSEYGRWLDEGCAGEMGYLREHFPLLRNASSVLPGAVSVLLFALPWPLPGLEYPAGNGFISSYARGRDYHKVMRSKLRDIIRSLSPLYPGASFRAAADSAPVPEVETAAETNFGRRGRSSLLISERQGSAFFLGEIITDAFIRKSFPEPADPCRGCDRCLRRCPGHAIRGDGFIDARKCLSYLTIEFHGRESVRLRRVPPLLPVEQEKKSQLIRE